jgi:hypothetical protein
MTNRNTGRSVPTREEGVGTVVVLVGGTFQSVTEYAETAAADIVIYADVQSEVAGVAPDTNGNVLTLRLATGETLGTLTKENCPEGLTRFLQDRSGVNLAVGLGQLRAVGDLVAKQLLTNPAFHDFVEKEVFERLLQIHGGCLEHVEILVTTSIAGGTGSVNGPALAKTIAEVILQFSNATVHVQALRVGSLSFSGLGDRVHLNGAATLSEDLDYVLDRDRHPREIRSMMLVEIPMVGAQKVERDRFAMQLMQAVRAADVQRMFGRSAPNEALNSAFGTIHILRPSFFSALCDRRIASEIARTFETQLEELLRVSPRLGVADEITVTLSEESLSIAAPKELAEQIRRAKGVTPLNIMSECLQSPGRYSVDRVLVSISGQMRSSLRNLINMPGATLAELAERLSVLRALAFKLQQQMQERSPELVKAKKQFEMAEAQLRAVLASFFPESWLDHFLALFSNRQTNVVQFQNLVRGVRQKAQAVAKLQAELDGLQGGLNLVNTELGAEQVRILRAVEMLRVVAGPASPTCLVRAGSLDSVLPSLLDFASVDLEDLPESIFRLLASCVTEVTMAGLASIVGALEIRPHQIAIRLAQAQAPTRAPAWGGKRHLGGKQRVLVLPPMSPDDSDSLRQLVAGLDGGIVLAFGQSAQAGANVVLLEVQCPRHAGDIFTPFHLQNLKRACEEPDLYFTDGHDPTRWLGMSSSNGAPSMKEACNA